LHCKTHDIWIWTDWLEYFMPNMPNMPNMFNVNDMNDMARLRKTLNWKIDKSKPKWFWHSAKIAAEQSKWTNNHYQC
jgi:hypothetical protein